MQKRVMIFKKNKKNRNLNRRVRTIQRTCGRLALVLSKLPLFKINWSNMARSFHAHGRRPVCPKGVHARAHTHRHTHRQTDRQTHTHTERERESCFLVEAKRRKIEGFLFFLVFFSLYFQHK